MTIPSWEKQLHRDVPFAEERAQIISRKVMVRLESSTTSNRKFLYRFSMAAALMISGVCALFLWQPSILSTNTVGTNPVVNTSSEMKVVEMKGPIKFSIFDDQAFKTNYGNEIRSQFPDVQPTFSDGSAFDFDKKDFNYEETYERMIDEQKPDVLIIYSIQHYKELALHGKILDLTPYVMEEGLLQNKVPAVVNALSSVGDGKIYGMAPTFNGRALYYNKDLFDQYNVPYPTNEMSWADVMKLAKRFPVGGSEDMRIYGFHELYMPMMTPSYLVNMMAHTNGLSYTDKNIKYLTMDTREWNNVFHLALDAYKSGIVHRAKTYKIHNNRVEQKDNQAMDLFSKGKAAMALDTIGLLNGVNASSFQYGIVTAPSDPNTPNVNDTLLPAPIFAVNAQSDHIEQAVEIVKFVNGEKIAKGAQSNGNITSDLHELEHKYGDKLRPFYTRSEPDNRRTVYVPVSPLSYSFFKSFGAILEQQYEAVIDGKQTVEDAQSNIQKQGQALLDN